MNIAKITNTLYHFDLNMNILILYYIKILVIYIDGGGGGVEDDIEFIGGDDFDSGAG